MRAVKDGLPAPSGEGEESKTLGGCVGGRNSLSTLKPSERVSLFFDGGGDPKLLYSLPSEALKPSCLSEKRATKPI